MASGATAVKNKIMPFYNQITNVKEDYVNNKGAPSSVDLPLVTLPAGTILFRGLKIPDARKGEDIRYFYRDFLGTPEGAENVCLSPIHNVFFYPFPYIAFGASAVGKTFTMMQMVVLVHPVTIVACISPSPLVRGTSKQYSGTAPWQRCNNFSGPEYDCHPQSAKETDAKTYDTCLSPEYQVRSGTRGWMAIANLDSINPKRKSWNRQAPVSTMGSFLKSLNSQIPGEGKKALAWAYTDDGRQAGYPEIALYPYRIHKGRGLITRSCPDEKAAMRLLENEAASDNLNYLPIAAFTKNGVIDMVSGYFSYERLGVSNNSFDSASAQQAILANIHTFMDSLQTKGIDLPHYGPSKLVFDSRTGFFALDKVVPSGLWLGDIGGIGDIGEKIAYRSLLLSLGGEEAQRRALTYMLLFRTFMPEHFMEKYQINPGFSARRSMVFSRYPVLANLFTDLQLDIPSEFKAPLGRAGKLYRNNTMARTKSQTKQNEVLEEDRPYGPTTPEGFVGPWPGPAPEPPPLSLGGGRRRTTSRLDKGKTSEHKARQYASLFANVWRLR